MPENKKKLPKHTCEPKYPWTHVKQHLCGHEDIDCNNPGHEYRRTAHTSGTYKDTGEDGALRKLGVATKHQIVTQGHSTTNEGPTDTLHVSGKRSVNTRGTHEEVADNHSKGIGGKRLVASKENQTNYATGKRYNMYAGVPGLLESVAGKHYKYNDSDRSEQIDGNKHVKVTKDHGIYSDKGNMDTQLNKGKLRVKTGDQQLYDSDDSIHTKAAINITEDAKKEIIDTAGKKITLQVGCSQIVITSDEIVIKSKKIRFEKC